MNEVVKREKTSTTEQKIIYVCSVYCNQDVQ